MNKVLVGLVCGFIGITSVCAENVIIEPLKGNIFSNKSFNVKIPSGERIKHFMMGCNAAGCFHTIVSVKESTIKHPCTYIMRTFSVRDGKLISENTFFEK